MHKHPSSQQRRSAYRRHRDSFTNNNNNNDNDKNDDDDDILQLDPLDSIFTPRPYYNGNRRLTHGDNTHEEEIRTLKAEHKQAMNELRRHLASVEHSNEIFRRRLADAESELAETKRQLRDARKTADVTKAVLSATNDRNMELVERLRESTSRTPKLVDKAVQVEAREGVVELNLDQIMLNLMENSQRRWRKRVKESQERADADKNEIQPEIPQKKSFPVRRESICFRPQMRRAKMSENERRNSKKGVTEKSFENVGDAEISEDSQTKLKENKENSENIVEENSTQPDDNEISHQKSPPESCQNQSISTTQASPDILSNTLADNKVDSDYESKKSILSQIEAFVSERESSTVDIKLEEETNTLTENSNCSDAHLPQIIPQSKIISELSQSLVESVEMATNRKSDTLEESTADVAKSNRNHQKKKPFSIPFPSLNDDSSPKIERRESSIDTVILPEEIKTEVINDDKPEDIEVKIENEETRQKSPERRTRSSKDNRSHSKSSSRDRRFSPRRSRDSSHRRSHSNDYVISLNDERDTRRIHRRQSTHQRNDYRHDRRRSSSGRRSPDSRYNRSVSPARDHRRHQNNNNNMPFSHKNFLRNRDLLPRFQNRRERRDDNTLESFKKRERCTIFDDEPDWDDDRNYKKVQNYKFEEIWQSNPFESAEKVQTENMQPENYFESLERELQKAKGEMSVEDSSQGIEFFEKSDKYQMSPSDYQSESYERAPSPPNPLLNIVSTLPTSKKTPEDLRKISYKNTMRTQVNIDGDKSDDYVMVDFIESPDEVPARFLSFSDKDPRLRRNNQKNDPLEEIFAPVKRIRLDSLGSSSDRSALSIPITPCYPRVEETKKTPQVPTNYETKILNLTSPHVITEMEEEILRFCRENSESEERGTVTEGDVNDLIAVLRGDGKEEEKSAIEETSRDLLKQYKNIARHLKANEAEKSAEIESENSSVDNQPQTTSETAPTEVGNHSKSEQNVTSESAEVTLYEDDSVSYCQEVLIESEQAKSVEIPKKNNSIKIISVVSFSPSENIFVGSESSGEKNQEDLEEKSEKEEIETDKTEIDKIEIDEIETDKSEKIKSEIDKSEEEEIIKEKIESDKSETIKIKREKEEKEAKKEDENPKIEETSQNTLQEIFLPSPQNFVASNPPDDLSPTELEPICEIEREIRSIIGSESGNSSDLVTLRVVKGDPLALSAVSDDSDTQVRNLLEEVKQKIKKSEKKRKTPKKKTKMLQRSNFSQPCKYNLRKTPRKSSRKKSHEENSIYSDISSEESNDSSIEDDRKSPLKPIKLSFKHSSKTYQIKERESPKRRKSTCGNRRSIDAEFCGNSLIDTISSTCRRLRALSESESDTKKLKVEPLRIKIIRKKRKEEEKISDFDKLLLESEKIVEQKSPKDSLKSPQLETENKNTENFAPPTPAEISTAQSLLQLASCPSFLKFDAIQQRATPAVSVKPIKKRRQSMYDPSMSCKTSALFRREPSLLKYLSIDSPWQPPTPTETTPPMSVNHLVPSLRIDPEKLTKPITTLNVTTFPTFSPQPATSGITRSYGGSLITSDGLSSDPSSPEVPEDTEVCEITATIPSKERKPPLTNSPRPFLIEDQAQYEARRNIQSEISKIVTSELHVFYEMQKFESKEPRELFNAMVRTLTAKFSAESPDAMPNANAIKNYIFEIFYNKDVIKTSEDFLLCE